MPAISSDNLIRIVAIISIVAIVTRVWLKERRRSDDNSPMEVLLHMCLGDRRQVKRLIFLGAVS
jgi:hypothetical protein